MCSRSGSALAATEMRCVLEQQLRGISQIVNLETNLSQQKLTGETALHSRGISPQLGAMPPPFQMASDPLPTCQAHILSYSPS